MRNYFLRGLIGMSLVAALLTPAFGQVQAPATDGWEASSTYSQQFDPQHMVTVKGKVTEIDRNFVPLHGMSPGFEVVITSADGQKHSVQVGPIWFTEYFRRRWNMQLNDLVEVTGSQVKIDGKTVIMATRGKKGDLSMVVRNSRGMPVWDPQVEDF